METAGTTTSKVTLEANSLLSRRNSVGRSPDYKIVILGRGAVGKSAIALRLVADDFKKDYDPTIEDSYTTIITTDNITSYIELIDTAGQEQYSSLVDSWVKQGDGFVLVYSVNDRESFEYTKKLYKHIQNYKDPNNTYDIENNSNKNINNDYNINYNNIYFNKTNTSQVSNIEELFDKDEEIYCNESTYDIILIGNKCDLEDERRKLTYEEGEKLSLKMNCSFFECSAKTGKNVNRAFDVLIRNLREPKEEVSKEVKPTEIKNPTCGETCGKCQIL